MLPKSEKFKTALSAIRARIAAAKRHGTHSGMIDYSGCIYICDELIRIVNETDSLISDGKYSTLIAKFAKAMKEGSALTIVRPGTQKRN